MRKGIDAKKPCWKEKHDYELQSRTWCRQSELENSGDRGCTNKMIPTKVNLL